MAMVPDSRAHTTDIGPDHYQRLRVRERLSSASPAKGDDWPFSAVCAIPGFVDGGKDRREP